jgi:hypothetical protein
VREEKVHKQFIKIIVATVCLQLAACANVISPENQAAQIPSKTKDTSFTLAVIPDTQNYVDYTRQKAAGFALDSNELFIQQMRYIANNSVPNGGDIAFVASVGDVWQHQTIVIDPEHVARGHERTANPILDKVLEVTDKTFTVEIPKAVEGYQLLSDAGVPFGVAPGNHDYDALWTAAEFPPNLSKPFSELKMEAGDLGILHVGGLNNFRSVFGDDKPFYKDKPWYIDSFRGGANSAQKFTAGGYEFLHIALEMQADDAVVKWVESVLANNPGLPTIISTHDYLSVKGTREAVAIIDLSTADPQHHNDAQQMWDKLYSQHDQILMVLCGHQHGQNHRVDNNVNGKPVYQILADYQDRGQVAIDAGQAAGRLGRQGQAVGDGWFRLMEFDLAGTTPTVKVKTYSTYYKEYSGEAQNYSKWYKAHEHPDLSDADFLKKDDYTLELTKFHQRFSSARRP